MKSIINIVFVVSLGLMISCKNEPKSTTTGEVKADQSTQNIGDVSKFENLNHDFSITPEGSKLFVKGFFSNALINSAITIDKGKLHIMNGIISVGEFNLNMSSLAMVANRNEAVEKFMKSDKSFDVSDFPNGLIKITECLKAVNDQQATHILKGDLSIHGKTVPFNVRVRIDYTPKAISINSDQIIIKSSDLGIEPGDKSQENIYFSLTLNAAL